MRTLISIQHSFIVPVIFVILFTVMPVLPALPQDRVAFDLNAQEILNRMDQIYAQCETYYDSGLVKIVSFEGSGSRIDERPFSTAFVRPDRFRFEFSKKARERDETHFIVWRENDRVQTWSVILSGVTEHASLMMAIAGATGVSGASAYMIPRMLLPEETSGRRLSSIDGATRIDDADHFGTSCYRVKGLNGKTPTTIWIDQETFLVRRIDSTSEFENPLTEETITYNKTITYNAAINTAITDEMLAFQAPSH